ncbi:methyltransferase domain-containing protein [Pseudomonadota bacterium]
MIDIEEKKIRIIQSIRDQSKFKQREVERIINKSFREIPAGVRLAYDKYGLGEKKVLDIGSGFGSSLMYWGKGSAAVEVQPVIVRFLKEMGFNVYELNVEEGLGIKVRNKFDAVYSMNLIEHLVAPHLFLLRVHKLLKNGGLFVLGHPTTPLWPFESLWKMYFGYQGWVSVEHVNFFTPKTIELMLNRAGFEVENQLNPGLISKSVPKSVQQFFVWCGADVISVARKKKFRYDSKRVKDFSPRWASDVFVYHGK